MYRCKECNAKYDEYPDFCDCGSIDFEEIKEEQLAKTVDNEITEFEKRALTDEEKVLLENNEKEKKKLLIILCLIAIFCLIIFLLPLDKNRKIELQENDILPSDIKIFVK